jgi:thioester reductase-like protein/FkbH-like protein
MDNLTMLNISPEQERLWYLHHLYPQSAFLNCAIAIRITGEINYEVFNNCIIKIVERHEALRSRFLAINGKPLCILDDIKTNYLESKILPSNSDKAHIDPIIKIEVDKPFSLTEGPLFKTVLASISKTEHIFLFIIHHIIADARTLELFLYELTANYECLIDNSDNSLPLLPLSFYNVIENQPLPDEYNLVESKDFWSKKLAKIKPLTNLPIAARASTKTYSADKHIFRINATLTQTILHWCQTKKISPNALFLTAFQAVIVRITEEHNFLIGMAIDNRVKAVSDNLMGYFAVPTIIGNTVQLDMPFMKAVQQVQQEIMTVLFYRDLPLTAISSFLQPNWPDNTIPLIQLMFSYVGQLPVYQQNKYFDFEILTLERGGTDIDLFLTIVLSTDNFILGLQYNNTIFQTTVIEKIASMLETYLAQALIKPELTAAQLDIPRSLLAQQNALSKQLLPIAATFTVEPLSSTLNFWIRELKWPLKIEFLPYHQLLTQLLAPNSLFFDRYSHCNILLLRFEDILKYHTSNSANILNNYIDEFLTALHVALQRSKKNFLIGICPSSSAFHNQYQTVCNIPDLENDFLQKLALLTGVYTINSEQWYQHYPVAALFDSTADKLGHIPYSPEFYTSIATLIIRKLHNIITPVRKVIVLDCDNTLWQGVVSEEGITNIRLSTPYLFLQEFFIEQQTKGMLLCLCSKNIAADVLAVFSKRHDMKLKLAHITSHRINWNAKSDNLQALAAELNMGLDSFIFIDDNPMECVEVRLNCPQVLTLQLPTESADIPKFLQHLWLFDHSTTTKEDVSRTEFYQQNLQRQHHKTQASDYSNFIASLNLNTEISLVDSISLSRAAQLTQRTNQFNTTTQRRSENELQKLCELTNTKAWLVQVDDRFGQYGMVGLMIVEPIEMALKVDSFILSCRALSRGVEHKMLAYLGSYAKQLKLAEVHILYQKTEKNTPAMIFLESLPFIRKTTASDHIVYILLTEQANNISFDLENCSENLTTNISITASQVFQPIKNSIPYEDIANNWQDSVKIHAASILNKSNSNFAVSNDELPTNSTEQLILTLWQDILAIKKIGIYQNFFMLGGNSVQFVQLISRVINQFDMTIAFDSFLAVPTIHDMAILIGKLKSPDTKLTNNNNQENFIDFKGDIFLYDVPVKYRPLKLVVSEKPNNILLTGATGFLGAYLLRDLLLQTDATIYCLVRAQNDEQAIRRIRNNLLQYGIWDIAWQTRIKVVIGDLVETYFGLTNEIYQQLATTIECIYHNGALVNFIYPYNTLRAANVNSTREIIRLASMYILKPVHFISSIGIFDSVEFLNNVCIKEEQVPCNAQSLSTGYFQSKWVAEHLIKLARESGIPAAIYRPGNITGDSQTGFSAADDLFSRMIKTCFDFKLFPDIEVELVPVDYVSRAIVTIAQAAASDKNYHIVNPDRLTVSDYIQWSNSKKVHLQVLPLPDWIKKILCLVSEDSHHPLYPFLPILQGESFFEIASRRPLFDNSNTQAALQNSAVSCPKMSQALFTVYTAFFEKLHSKESQSLSI